MAGRRRLTTGVAVLGCALALVAIFLPWMATPSGTLAGWGSESHPDLRGMLAITCIAVALTLLAGAGAAAGVRRRVLAELAATTLLVGLVVASMIIAEFRSHPVAGASPSAAAWLAVAGLVISIAASIGAALTPDI